MARRSVLFSPGDRRSMLEKSLDTAADVVVFDLEDGVAPDDKDEARETVVEFLTEASVSEAEVLVRINTVAAGGGRDIEALGALRDTDVPDGIVLPKVENGDQVTFVDSLLGDVGLQRDIWCLIESPAGLLAARTIADHDAVTALVFGGEDYATAVGADRTESDEELLYPRQRVVACASAVGIDAIDGISTALDDPESVAADAVQARSFGFDGKLAIHPSQLEPINEAFTPDPDQVAWAKRVVAAVAESDSGALRVDDEMIDAPLIERARSILRRADAD